jgi:plasmid stabilization system protein ParE
MSFPIRLLPEAKAEFDAAADWYEQQRVGLGINFVARVREAFQRLAANPQLHATVYGDVRKAVVRQFP